MTVQNYWNSSRNRSQTSFFASVFPPKIGSMQPRLRMKDIFRLASFLRKKNWTKKSVPFNFTLKDNEHSLYGQFFIDLIHLFVEINTICLKRKQNRNWLQFNQIKSFNWNLLIRFWFCNLFKLGKQSSYLNFKSVQNTKNMNNFSM